jgi:hypothetical protein
MAVVPTVFVRMLDADEVRVHKESLRKNMKKM